MHIVNRCIRRAAAAAIAALLVACGGGGGSNALTQPMVTVPVITAQAASASVVAPAAASFSVTATGASGYQWRRNGTDISGATGSALAVSSTAPADNGSTFTVLVSNSAGSVTSASAVLSVAPPVAGVLSNESLLVSGVTRTFLKYTPSAMPAGVAPLVIVLHGGTEDGATAAGATRATAAWRDIADLAKFIVLYPDGIGGNWNDCRSDATVIGTADDVGFLDALITRAGNDRPIDATRVYVTGVSNGGLMSYRIAYQLAARVAGIGAVIANLPVDPAATCRPAGQPIGVVIMDGTADPLMPFAGGVVALSTSRGTVLSATATRDYWAGVNGCTGAPVSQTLADIDATDGSTVVKQNYASCSSGKPVVFFRLDGGGHNMPSKRYLSGSGSQNRDIEAAEEIWGVLRDVHR